MRISIVLYDDSGRTFSGEAILAPLEGSGTVAPKPARNAELNLRAKTSQEINFELPLRAFMKQHAGGKSGAEKFAMPVAYMTKGDTSATVAGSELEKQWNNMTSLMDGSYNRAHTTRAKDKGWVDSPGRGTYKLLPGWAEIMEGDASNDQNRSSTP